jgi:SOS-response transcriptional repressor LexA
LATYFNKSLDYLIEGKEPIGATQKIPIVGAIKALPVLSAENIIGETEVPANMVKDGNYFEVIVRDDSMSGAGLREGHKVLVREQTDLQDGQIGLIKVGRETLIRKVYTTNGSYLLLPTNPAFSEVKIGREEAVILGRARSVWFEV